MLSISIDGSCKRNGQPNCVSAGGVFMIAVPDNTDPAAATVAAYHTISAIAKESTNQRGELLALLLALEYIADAQTRDVQIITDSEYIYNAINNEWYANWQRKGWLTAAGEPVKNRDMWEKAAELLSMIHATETELVVYHIKGHCIPFGKVTAEALLHKDPSGKALYYSVLEKYDSIQHLKQDTLDQARALFLRNNKFELSDELLRLFVARNIVADIVATNALSGIA